MPPKYWILLGVLAIFASSSSLGENGIISVLARISGLGAIVVGGLIAKAQKDLGQKRLSAGRFGSVLLPLLLFLIFSTIPHGQFFQFAGYVLGLVLMWVALWASTYIDVDQIRYGLERGLAIMVVGSLISGITFPSIAVEGERLRGLANNANLLGFYCFALAAMVLLDRRRGVRSLVLLAASIAAIFAAASRGSMLGVALVFGMSALLSAGISRKIAIACIVLSAPVMGIWSREIALMDVALFRDNNSRDTSLANALSLFAANPYTGVGMDDTLIIASSPLRALAYAGIWGGLSILFIYIGLLRLSLRENTAAGLFCIAAIVHSFLEGWLLSPISPLFTVFMFGLLVIMRSNPSSSRANPSEVVPTMEDSKRIWSRGMSTRNFTH
ncbi:hypothetical protein [Arthrobacter sp. D1-17]